MCNLNKEYSNGVQALNEFRKMRNTVKRKLQEMEPESIRAVIKRAEIQGQKGLLLWAKIVLAQKVPQDLDKSSE